MGGGGGGGTVSSSCTPEMFRENSKECGKSAAWVKESRVSLQLQ